MTGKTSIEVSISSKSLCGERFKKSEDKNPSTFNSLITSCAEYFKFEKIKMKQQINNCICEGVPGGRLQT